MWLLGSPSSSVAKLQSQDQRLVCNRRKQSMIYFKAKESWRKTRTEAKVHSLDSLHRIGIRILRPMQIASLCRSYIIYISFELQCSFLRQFLVFLLIRRLPDHVASTLEQVVSHQQHFSPASIPREPRVARLRRKVSRLAIQCLSSSRPYICQEGHHLPRVDTRNPRPSRSFSKTYTCSKMVDG